MKYFSASWRQNMCFWDVSLLSYPHETDKDVLLILIQCLGKHRFISHYISYRKVLLKFLLVWFQTCRPQEPVHNYRICPPHSGQHTGILNTMTVAWLVRTDLINTHVFMIKWAVGTDDGQTVGTRVTTYYNNQEWNKNESFHCGG